MQSVPFRSEEPLLVSVLEAEQHCFENKTS